MNNLLKRVAVLIAVTSGGCTQTLPVWSEPVKPERARWDAMDALKRGIQYTYLPSVRAQAIEAMEKAAPREGLAWIRSALTDEHPAVRFAACMALGNLEDAASRDSLLRLLDDPNHSVRVGAVYALHRLGDTSHSGLLAHYLMQDDDMPAKRNAVLALGRLGETGAIPHLAKLVNHKDEALHAQALESLALLGQEDAMRQLAFNANSGTGPQQVFAIQALAATRNSRYLPVFRHRLENGEYVEVRLAAARALGEVGSDEGLKEAIKNIDFDQPKRGQENDPPENQIMRVRQLAALAAGAIGHSEALPLLTRQLENGADPRVQIASALAILQIVNRQQSEELPFALGEGVNP